VSSEIEKKLFQHHVTLLQERLWKNIDSQKSYDAIVVSSGKKDYYFVDDQSVPFERIPHFVQWCPAPGEGHTLILEKGKKPKLVFYCPDDYWHETPSAEGYWVESFDVELLKDRSKRFDSLKGRSSIGYIGPETDLPASFLANPDILVKTMDWLRSYKTPWEIYQLREASMVGARGHLAAQKCFMSGGSEFDIYLSYLKAVGQTDDELPYGTIIGLNEHAGYLHYEAKEQNIRGSVLLIDAGARRNGYGSDITRTWTSTPGGKTAKGREVSSNGLAVFNSILADLEGLQLEVCGLIKLGMTFVELHKTTCLLIAKIAGKHELVSSLPDDERMQLAIARTFFPHGLGHMLGIQVHDVAGHQFNMTGQMFDPNAEFPSLRNYRTIEAGHVFTIEPGFYFVPMLLDQLTSKYPEIKLNHRLVEELIPCGGIRIEDNIHMGPKGVENLTREAFKILSDSIS